MKMKTLGMVGLLCLSVAACAKVPAGNVGVIVDLYGSDKGVSSKEVGVGRYFVGWNKELFLFPTYMQNYVWTKDPNEGSPNDESISFQTADGLTVNADIGISYQIMPDKVSDIFQKYHKGVNEITDVFLHNMVRDALVQEASTKPIQYIYGRGKADLIDAVQKDVTNQVTNIGIKIDKIYWIGTIRVPPTVEDSINAKIEATQKAQQRQNEVAQAKAEAEKKVAEAEGDARSTLVRAKAQADANRLLAQSITPELVQYRALDRWDGKLPKFTGSAAIPFIDVNQISTQQPK